MKNSVLWFLAIGTALSGCAELNSIHRVHRASDNGPEIVTVDAKQRHLIISKETVSSIVGTDTVLTTNWRTCAEAAPDVFSAYAASGAAKGSKSGGQLSFGGAETAATIERTQTTNLLRESMYRTCERYLSGALRKEEFIIQSARDQRSMVAILAVEQLTGAIRAKSTIISGPATSASIIDGEEAANLVKDYTDALATAKKSATTAASTLDEAEKKGKCKSNDAKPADVDQADWATCVAAKTNKTQKDADLKTAETRLDKILDIAGKISNQINASTTSGVNDSATLSANRPSDLALVAVAGAVERIALSPGVDEPLMFCIGQLSFEAAKQPSTVAACVEILKLRAAQDLQFRSTVLEIANTADYASGRTEGALYNAFQQLLFAQINSTAPNELTQKIAKFEKNAEVSLGLAAKCVDAKSCVDAIKDSYLSELYFTNGKNIEAALLNWNKN